MYFESILGQEIPKRYIESSLNNQKISHAYLFEGPSGIGKKTFALEFAKILLKNNDLNNNPDFIHVSPDDKSFKISQVRDIIKDILIKPYGEKKVYLLEEVEKMTIQAQNSFLKTLEEPPDYVVIILLSNNINALLDTVKSRCEILKFSPLPIKEIERYLIEKKGIDSKEAKAYSAFSSGILSKALHLIDSQEFNQLREGIEKFIEYNLSKKVINILALISYLEKNKNDLDKILDLTITYFRDIMVIKEGILDEVVINGDRLEFLKEKAMEFNFSQISKIIDIIEEAKSKIRSNCNFQLTMEVMLLNIQEVVRW